MTTYFTPVIRHVNPTHVVPHNIYIVNSGSCVYLEMVSCVHLL